MTFVDTGGWYATYVVTDLSHEVAITWYSTNINLLVTTDYVIDELLTLLRARGQHKIALDLGSFLLSGVLCELERVQPDDFDQAWAVFSTYRDKAWSFTDCVSQVVMGRLGITEAFAFDEHFRQFGTITVVP